MSEDRRQRGLPHASYERFDSLQQLEDMFDELVPQAQRVIRVFDRSLSARYNTSARCALLRDFLRADPLNQLLIVLHEAENIARVAPRFVTVLQQFGHVAKVRVTPRSARHLYDAYAIFDASHYLHRFHHDHTRFARGRNELAGTQVLLDRFSELWDASTPSAAINVIGL
jgi:hypothetical protein